MKATAFKVVFFSSASSGVETALAASMKPAPGKIAEPFTTWSLRNASELSSNDV